MSNAHFGVGEKVAATAFGLGEPGNELGAGGGSGFELGSGAESAAEPKRADGVQGGSGRDVGHNPDLAVSNSPIQAGVIDTLCTTEVCKTNFLYK